MGLYFEACIHVLGFSEAYTFESARLVEFDHGR